MSKAKLFIKTKSGKRPISDAIRKGNKERVYKLLSKDGIDHELNTPDAEGNTPLLLALQLQDRESANLITEDQRTDLSASPSHKSPLFYSCELGWIDVMAKLLERGVDVNGKDERGNSAIHWLVFFFFFFFFCLFLFFFLVFVLILIRIVFLC